MQPRSQVLILARSNHWQVALARELNPRVTETKLVWALDMDDWIKEVTASPPAAAILELTRATWVSDCEQVWNVGSLTPNTAFFAVTTDDMLEWLPLIRVCGFIDCCRSLSGIRRTLELIHRQCRMRPTEITSIERWVEDRLPWKPAKNRPIFPQH